MADLSSRERALALANEVRIAQARFKRTLRVAGRYKAPYIAAKALEAPDDVVGRMQLDRLLGAMPFYGPKRIRRLMLYARADMGVLKRRVTEIPAADRRRIAKALLGSSAPVPVSGRRA